MGTYPRTARTARAAFSAISDGADCRQAGGLFPHRGPLWFAVSGTVRGPNGETRGDAHRLGGSLRGRPNLPKIKKTGGDCFGAAWLELWKGFVFGGGVVSVWIFDPVWYPGALFSLLGLAALGIPRPGAPHWGAWGVLGPPQEVNCSTDIRVIRALTRDRLILLVSYRRGERLG